MNNQVLKIVIVLIALSLYSCSDEGLGTDQTELQVTVLDNVGVPAIQVSIGYETGDVNLTWQGYDDALSYELQESSWEIAWAWWTIYSGEGSGFYLGNRGSEKTLYYRVRAIYAGGVSRWSDVVGIR